MTAMIRDGIRALMMLSLLSAPALAAKRSPEAVMDRGRDDFIAANEMLTKGDYNGAMDRLTAVLIKDPGNGIAREQIYQIAQLMAVNAAVFEQILPRRMTEDERADVVEIAYQSLRKTSPRQIERRLQAAERNEKRKYYLLACQNYVSMLTLPGLELETKYQIEKRLRAATQKVDAKIETLPEEIRSTYREAFTLMNLGDWESSIEDWQKYAQKSPTDAEVQKLLSIPEAVAVLREKGHLENAYTALQADDAKQSVALFEEALKANPNSSEAEKGLELARKRLEDERKARKVNDLLAAAEELLERKQKNKAVQALSDALRENPSDERALAMIQQVMESAGSAKTVVVNVPVMQRAPAPKPSDAVEKVLAARDGTKAETHYQKGLVYYSLRNYREAFNEFKVAVRYDPNSRKITQALQRVQSDLQFDNKK